MDAEPGGAPLQRGKIQDLRCGHRLFGGNAQNFIYHALAGKAHEDFLGKGFFDFVQPAQQLIVLLHGLGKAKARVQDPFADTRIGRLLFKCLEIPDYLRHYVVVVS